MPSPKSQGYITAAVHHERHLQMAVDLRLSLRDVDKDRPFALVTDANLRRVLHRFPDVFDDVFVISAERNFGQAAKLFAGEFSPYAETLFVDADCLVLASLDELWQHLAGKIFCVPGEYVAANDNRQHHNYAIADLCNAFAIERYYWASSPLFYFASAGRPLLAEILDVYCRVLPAHAIRRWDRPWPPDEIAFGIVGGRRHFSYFPPLQTLLGENDLARWRDGPPPHAIFHCVACPRVLTLAGLLRDISARRAVRNLPQGSRRHWLVKAIYKKLQRLANRTLGLPWMLKKA